MSILGPSTRSGNAFSGVYMVNRRRTTFAGVEVGRVSENLDSSICTTLNMSQFQIVEIPQNVFVDIIHSISSDCS